MPNRHMSRPICNAGGVGVTSTQKQEASHAELAHKAYKGAGKSFRGLHGRMNRQVDRRAAIDTLRVTADSRPQLDDEEAKQGLGHSPVEHEFYGRRSSVVLFDGGFACDPVCFSISIF